MILRAPLWIAVCPRLDLLVVLLCFLACPELARRAAAADSTGRVQFQQNDSKGELQVRIDGREAFVFRYGSDVDLPHYYPLRSPSGKLLTVQQTDPYPHHRSLWFADKVQLAGHAPVEFYMALSSKNANRETVSFTNTVRHVAFLPGSFDSAKNEIHSHLIWEMDAGQTPVIDEFRRVRVEPLGEGEYLLDITFKLVANYGDVTFRSDAVHYAWPYVRMHPQFSVDRGGTITNSEGGTNEKGTHNQAAVWVDYSNLINGSPEGLAIFSHPHNPHPHRWLTRDYGTFGPRRPDARSGAEFTLLKGDTLEQRVGVLVHRGDARTGHVAERYQQYIR